MSGRIFINYRRGDDPGNTGRLFDRLQEAFTPEQLFMDVDSIKPGLDFVKVLEEQVSQCDIVLAVIGHNWIDARDEAGARRLDNPEDFVRIEIGSALDRGKRVIPVLVGDARMPRSDELPEPIKPLARRHAVRLTHERFRADMQGLVKALQEALDEADARSRAQAAQQAAADEERRRAEQAAREHAQAQREAKERARQERAHRRLVSARGATTAQSDQPGAARQRVGRLDPSSRRSPRRLMLIGGVFAALAGVVAIWIAALPTRRPVPAPAPQLAISGPGVLTFTGPEAGPFTPDRSSLTLRATGSGFHWSIDGTAPQWLSVSPKEGDLTPDASAEVTVAVTTGAQSLMHGQHSGQLIFRNHSSNEIVARSVNLVVQEPKETPLSLARERELKTKDTFKECSDCPQMIVVPAGSFTMGSPASEPGRDTDEGPQHRVTIARQFAVGTSALTFDEWDACVADGGCNGYKPPDQGGGRGRLPVINVSWNDANAYVAWLAKKTGKPYRLLSEAEREYVTRAGTTTPFWWGNSISPSQANYDGNDVYGNGVKGEYRQRTVPVDSFATNPWGLYQVHGNVWEWTEDCYHDSYGGAPPDGSAWTKGDCSNTHVFRGGSWRLSPRDLRSASRGRLTTGNRRSDLGFRVGRTLITP
jgi:formylglycine-generating enzyme required for sulfatase activity